MTTRSRVYGTEAVVLRRMDLGEADRLLTLFTPTEGKLRAIAKGVRRPGSRKAGHLEPFARSRLILARGRELDIITQAEAVDQFPRLSSDLERLAVAAHLVELMDRFTVQEGGAEALYDLLVNALRNLDSGDDLATLTRYYELRLLDHVGFRPEFFHCVECHQGIQPQDQYFSNALGGVLCPNCGRRQENAVKVSVAALKVLRHFQRSDYQVANAAQIRTAVQSEVEALMESYLTHLLERRLNASKFLREVRELGASGRYKNTPN
jgi:DNA repair protein RecO (recombination protein O)